MKIDCINHDHELFFEKKINKLSDDNFNIAFDYNEESFKFVNDFFAIDFELFGYKKYNTINEFRQCYDERIKKSKINNYHLIENNAISELENKNIIYDLYKSILKLRYGLSEEEKFFDKIKKIINIMLLSIHDNAISENVLEIIKIKDSIIEKNKNEIKIMNTRIFDLIKNNYCVHECKNCNISFFNTDSFNSHIIICKNKLKEK